MEPRSRSRSPIRSKVEDQTIDDDINTESINMQEAFPDETQKNKPKHYISLSNTPVAWNISDVKKFISGAVNSKHVTQNMSAVFFKKNSIPNAPKVLIVKFSNKEAAEEACEQLKDVEISGNKLFPKIMPINMKKNVVKKPIAVMKNNIPPFGNKNRNMKSNVFQPIFNKQTYGLNVKFLQNLGIEPPLNRRIFINNLSPKVDEEKLEEVFSLAGKIVDIHLMTNLDGVFKGMATVTYDHPVEAVQAISMFNHKSLFGSPLKICLDMKKNVYQTLPLGLSDIGLGLGENGSPLQYVRAHVEIEQIKHDIREWMDTANETNQIMNMNTNSPNNNNVPQLQNNLASLNSQISNQVNLSNTLNPSSMINQDVQTFVQGLVQQANLLNVLSGQKSLHSVPAFTANMGSQSFNQGWKFQGNQPVSTALPQIASNFTQVMNNQQIHSRNNLQSTGGFQGILNKTSQMHQSKFKAPKLCYRCRQPGHEARDCQAGRCEICNNEGHTAATCWSKSSGESSRQQPQLSGGSSYVPPRRPNDGGLQISGGVRDDEDITENGSDMVVFKNLPSSVSIEALNNKMQEVGEVKFSELTGRGKAIVRFFRARHAEKCVKLFDRSRVDGQVIEVQYV